MKHPGIMKPSHFGYDPTILYVEIFSFLIIIFACFLIYYKTREIYNLTEHKGIKYFRKGFLFFGFAHIMRLFFVVVGSETRYWEFFSRQEVFVVTLFFGLVSIQYLFSSMYSKNIKEYYIYIVTILVIGLSYFFENPIFVGLYGIVVGLGFAIFSFVNYHKSKKKVFSQIYLIYILLCAFWIVLWIGQTISRVLDLSRGFLPLVGAVFFIIILYRVLKRLKV